MNKSKTMFITELVGYLMFVATIYCTLSGIILFIDDSDKMLINTMFVMIVPLTQYFFKYIRSAIVFAICHLAILGICAAVIMNGTFDIMQSLLYCILWIAMFIIFFSIRKTDKVSGVQSPTAAPIAIIILVYFITSGKATTTYDRVISIILIVSILAYFINLYIANSYIFFEGNVASGVMNYKRSMSFTSRLMFGFVATCGAIMGISIFLPSFGLVEMIKKILFTIFKAIVNLLATNHAGKIEKTTPKPVDVEEPTPTPLDVIASIEPEKHVDMDKYFNFIYVGLAIAVIIIVIILIFAGLKTLERKNDDEERFFLSPFADDDEEQLPKEHKDKSEGFFTRVLSRNPNRRVRRAFHKAISINVDLGESVRSSYTPTQLCDATSIRKKKKTTKWDFIPTDNVSSASDYSDDELEQLKVLYEQARYGNTPCSKEDAAKAEMLQKKL